MTTISKRFLGFPRLLQIPVVAVEWLAILLRVRDDPVSSLGPETGYPEVFRGFLQSFYTNIGTVPKLGHDRFFQYPFQIIMYESLNHLVLYGLSNLRQAP
jgi:hypothetical protein